MVNTEKKTSITVEPLGRRVLVVRDTVVEKTDWGLILPDAGKTPPAEGKVVAKGDECIYIEVGDKVIIPYACGTKIVVRGEEAVVILEEDIMVRLKEV